MKSKISVIIPVYNGEKFLKRTVEKVLESTYENIEVLLIDDGSTDDSLQICQDLQRDDSRVVVYHQKNRGIIASRNKGIELSTGDYVCFCDQDDLVEKKTYELMEKSIEQEQVDLCICSTGKYTNGECLPYEIYLDDILDKKAILFRIVFPILFDGYRLKTEKMSNKRATGTIWKCMINRSLIVNNNIRFKRFINYEDDLLFFLDVLCKCEKVVTLGYVGYYWRINSESESYRWKYIENIEVKENDYYNYLSGILDEFGVNDQTKKEFKKFSYCLYITDLIDNEGSPENLKEKRVKYSYLKEKIYDKKDFTLINGGRNIQWGLLRRKIIVELLQIHMVRMAYYFNVFYRKIKKIGIRSDLWSRIEKVMRGK